MTASSCKDPSTISGPGRNECFFTFRRTALLPHGNWSSPTYNIIIIMSTPLEFVVFFPKSMAWDTPPPLLEPREKSCKILFSTRLMLTHFSFNTLSGLARFFYTHCVTSLVNINVSHLLSQFLVLRCKCLAVSTPGSIELY